MENSSVKQALREIDMILASMTVSQQNVMLVAAARSKLNDLFESITEESEE